MRNNYTWRLYFLFFIFFLPLVSLIVDKNNFTPDPKNDWKINNFGLPFNSIQFINSNTGWCCGGYGTVVKTTNAGINWFYSTDTSAYQINFNKIYFLSTITGFVTATAYDTTGYIIRTTNTGDNWQYQRFPNRINSVFFTDNQNGHAAANNGFIYKTTNNGINWYGSNPGLTKYNYAIYFLNSNTGFLGGTNLNNKVVLLKTTNSGTNWNTIFVDTGYTSIQDICFTSQSTGFISIATRLLRTTNQGVNWVMNDSCLSGIRKVQFVDSLCGFMCGWNFLKKTTNGGLNWIQLINNIWFNSISFVNSQTGYGATQGLHEINRIQKTTDGGNTWFSLLDGTEEFLYSLCFNTNSNAFLVSYRQIFRTTDGGDHWIYPNFMGSDVLSCVHFVNAYTGWVMGGNGSFITAPFYTTYNGGESWNQEWHDFRRYNQICSIDTVAFCTGMSESPYAGFIKRKSITSQWITVFNFPGKELFGIYFLNRYNGFAVGDSGKVFKSTDFGYNWIQYSSPSSQINYSVYFVDSLKGWIVGNVDYGYAGQVLKTTNGGVNWNIDLQVNTYLTKVAFVNHNTGWIIGGKGTVLYTTNCGVNWISYPKITSLDLFSIYFKDGRNGWILGDNGLLLKTNNCGGLVGINNISEQMPDRFILKQNYPNPFNATTSIKYQVESIKQIKLVVFDILGKEVTTLVNERQGAETYEINFDGSNLASGIYFYKLIAGDFSQTRKMVLLK